MCRRDASSWRIGEWGSARFPKTSALAGQTSTHAGTLAPGKTLRAEGALFHHALGARRKLGLGVPDIRARVRPVEAARAVRAGGHAVAAADTAVPVHGHDAVFAFQSGPGGADPHARRIVALVAQHHGGGCAQGRVLVHLRGERARHRLFPDPPHLVRAHVNGGNVMRLGGRPRCSLVQSPC